MMKNKASLYRTQRDWRRRIISRLKDKLGRWCRGCQTADFLSMVGVPGPATPLELIIPNRKAEDLAAYGTNTITIYNQILKGKISLDRVTLLCDECHFRMRQED